MNPITRIFTGHKIDLESICMISDAHLNRVENYYSKYQIPSIEYYVEFDIHFNDIIINDLYKEHVFKYKTHLIDFHEIRNKKLDNKENSYQYGEVKEILLENGDWIDVNNYINNMFYNDFNIGYYRRNLISMAEINLQKQIDEITVKWEQWKEFKLKL